MKKYKVQISEIRNEIEKRNYGYCPLDRKICEEIYTDNLSLREIKRIRKEISETIDSFRIYF